MDSQIPMKIRHWFQSAEDNADHYTLEEFREIIEAMIKKSQETYNDAKKYNANSEMRMQRYVIESVLEPLLGKLTYGKRKN